MFAAFVAIAGASAWGGKAAGIVNSVVGALASRGVRNKSITKHAVYVPECAESPETDGGVRNRYRAACKCAVCDRTGRPTAA